MPRVRRSRPAGGKSKGKRRRGKRAAVGAAALPMGGTDSARAAAVFQPLGSAAALSAKQVAIDLGRDGGLVFLRTFAVTVVRPKDLLHLTFQFLNLSLKKEDAPPARLVRTRPDRPAYLVVYFPPQHVGEQAFFETHDPAFPLDPKDPDVGAAPETPGRPSASRLADRSRLVFRLPDEVESIPYTLEALLDWSKLQPSVVPAALPPPHPLFWFLTWESGLLTSPWAFELKAPLAPKAAFASAAVLKVLSAAGAADLQVIRPDVGIASRFRPRFPLLPPIMEPQLQQTAIEAPYRLIVSPSHLGGWAHSRVPVTQKTGRAELWHTRLGVRAADGSVDEENDYYRTLRAVWSPDYRANLLQNHLNVPFRMSLDGRDRNELVWLTADFSLRCEARVISVHRLMLSSLGAWMNVRYAGDVPVLPKKRKKKLKGAKALTVEEWRHQAAMGRDQYVRVVYKGYLLPFGHRASLVKVTERKFLKQRTSTVAYLFQRMYIIVREPEKTYPAFGQQHDGRLMPFRRVRITTLVTPNLDDPVKSEAITGEGQSAFWPMVSKKEFLFHLVAEDVEGQRCEFTAPLIFVDNGIAKSAALTSAINHYKAASEARRRRPLSGQKVAFAESGASPGSTTFEADHITFGAEPQAAGVKGAALELQNQPGCYPTIARAEVQLLAAKQVTGQGQSAKIEFHDTYRDGGFTGANQEGQVFATLVGSVPLTFPADKSGGVATPNLTIQGLSRRFGPLGGATSGSVSSLAGGAFNPKDFFSGAGARILGGISLGDIIPTGFAGGKNVPKLTTTPVYPGGDKLAPPEAIDTLLEWKPNVQAAGPFKPGPGSKLELLAKLHTDLAAAKSTYEIRGVLTDFDMDLFGFVVLKFAQVAFEAKSGQKMDVKPDIKEVVFGGPLEFVNELKDYLSGTGGSGFSLDLTPSGVRAGFTLAIPTIGLGILTIQNIAFSAGVHLPFTGEPVRLRFAFCERAHPFLLTVFCFGGGGFFALALGLDGVELLEASLEFGASVAIDIGVASGEVHIMAGIYYKWEDKGGKGSALLTGYVRLGGEVEVLAIISISVEFYLGLSYATEGNKVWGEATLTVRVEILFFSIGVSMTVRREFADPDRITFAKQMTQAEWDTYCEAFA